MMEQDLNSEDMAIFEQSLILLHSPDIDSERTLYNLMNMSIRKHHHSRPILHGKNISGIPLVETRYRIHHNKRKP